MAEANENNNGGKRGRPKNSPNKTPSYNKLKNSSRDLINKETGKKIGLFVHYNMTKMQAIFDQLTPNQQARFLIEMAKFTTSTYAQEVQLKKGLKEEKKQINKIEISYEKPEALPEPVIKITPHEEIEDIDSTDADDIDVETDIDDNNDPF
ncbi:hypothetical protein [Sphingobacterium daejeonense]|uniref:hypothetical protein n=1 Tax=Sphingobacterium daejeonense TaxID=371142 RepID=UPI0010C528AA|nr:hypothetical protein [Sphingobacterium daejeonense]VTP97635.1 Uncharacterised protein [Sphingobacterium daejeonense]